jgi:hypothetical protein
MDDERVVDAVPGQVITMRRRGLSWFSPRHRESDTEQLQPATFKVPIR